MKLVLFCFFALGILTIQSVAGADTTPDVTTDNTSVEDSNATATDVNETESTTNSKDTVTVSSVATSSDFLCYSCGNYSSNMTTGCKSMTSYEKKCPDNECWIYMNNNGSHTYARGCISNDNTVSAFKCEEYKSKQCMTISDDQVCAKCCTSEKCNSGDLEDSDSGAPIPIGAFFITAATLVVLLIK